MKHEFDTLDDMLKEISPYITARALARICGINESQMLQYKSGQNKSTYHCDNQRKIEYLCG